MVLLSLPGVAPGKVRTIPLLPQTGRALKSENDKGGNYRLPSHDPGGTPHRRAIRSTRAAGRRTAPHRGGPAQPGAMARPARRPGVRLLADHRVRIMKGEKAISPNIRYAAMASLMSNAERRRSPRPSYGCVRTRYPSSSVPRWWTSAAKRHRDGHSDARRPRGAIRGAPACTSLDKRLAT